MIWEIIGLWLIFNAVIGFMGGIKFVIGVNTVFGGCILAGFFAGIGIHISSYLF